MIVTGLGGLGALAPAAAAKAPAQPSTADLPWVTIAVVEPPMIVRTTAAVEGASAGVMSAGLGSVNAVQTYLDISQGNRVFDHLYDVDAIGIDVGPAGVDPSDWQRLRKRGRDAPAEIVPGLLGEQLRQAGIPVRAAPDAGYATLIGVDSEGHINAGPEDGCPLAGCGPGLSIVRAELGELSSMVEAQGPDDLLIAVREPPALDGLLLPILAAGPGFSGSLRSDTTRTDGYVLATDIAPTILERFGIEPRPEMTGEPIRGDGERSDEELLTYTERLAERPGRASVVLVPLAIWFGLTALVALILRSRGARAALPLLAVSCAWGPAMLLIGAAAKPGAGPEALIFGLGSPALAAASLALLRAWGALALACAVSVGAHAVDVVTGSPLTALSVLGPNPAGGVRFFGIGNELEATLAVLTLVGTGAALAALRASGRLAIGATFAIVAGVAAIAFAAGRFGADVGAAIVLAVGAAVAVALTLDLPRRTILILAVVLPVAGLAVLAISDLAFGGAHFVDSVLGVDSPGALADTAERRLRATWRSFTDPDYPVLLVLTAIVAAVGFWRRDEVISWFGDRRAARDGFIAAVAAIAVGTVANDSGSTVATIGMVFLATAAGLAWATRGTAAAAIAAIIALGGLGAAPQAARAAEPGEPRVVIAVLPDGLGVERLASVPGISIGLINPSIGVAPAEQAYLDVGQGNRISYSLYDRPLRRIRFDDHDRVRREDWRAVLDRADEAPGTLIPGLLGSTIAEAGLVAGADVASGDAALIAADRDGAFTQIESGECGQGGGCADLAVIGTKIKPLKKLVGTLDEETLLIAFERFDGFFGLGPLGIVGGGFSGSLTSDTTRSEGLVAATDIAPTVLGHLGLEVPEEMNGKPIRAEGEADPEALADLRNRLEDKGARRGPVIGVALLAWVIAAATGAIILFGPGARFGLALLALALVYLPAVLLLTGPFNPSLELERWIAICVPPLLGALTLRLLPGYRALAFACGATTLAFCIDVALGLDLIDRAILGPNLAAGGRFFGINNEVEAITAVIIPVGVGAALAASGVFRDRPRAAIAAFVGVGTFAAAFFALGRFGADVGAAIVLPVGAAAAAAVLTGSRRAIAIAFIAPVAGVLALFAADLVLGGDAHLTETILGSGGSGEILDTVERRLRQTANSFTFQTNVTLLPFAGALIALAILRWRHIRSLYPEPEAWAGFVGALAATVVGTLANDSGATLLVFGTFYLAATTGFAWAVRSWERAGKAS